MIGVGYFAEPEAAVLVSKAADLGQAEVEEHVQIVVMHHKDHRRLHSAQEAWSQERMVYLTLIMMSRALLHRTDMVHASSRHPLVVLLLVVEQEEGQLEACRQIFLIAFRSV